MSRVSIPYPAPQPSLNPRCTAPAHFVLCLRDAPNSGGLPSALAITAGGTLQPANSQPTTLFRRQRISIILAPSSPYLLLHLRPCAARFHRGRQGQAVARGTPSAIQEFQYESGKLHTHIHPCYVSPVYGQLNFPGVFVRLQRRGEVSLGGIVVDCWLGGWCGGRWDATLWWSTDRIRCAAHSHTSLLCVSSPLW